MNNIKDILNDWMGQWKHCEGCNNYINTSIILHNFNKCKENNTKRA